MNRCETTSDGAVSKQSFVKHWNTSKYTAGEWGLNREELSLFHNIRWEIDWSGGIPTLVTKGSADELAQDRFYMYGR